MFQTALSAYAGCSPVHSRRPPDFRSTPPEGSGPVPGVGGVEGPTIGRYAFDEAQLLLALLYARVTTPSRVVAKALERPNEERCWVELCLRVDVIAHRGRRNPAMPLAVLTERLLRQLESTHSPPSRRLVELSILLSLRAAGIPLALPGLESGKLAHQLGNRLNVEEEILRLNASHLATRGLLYGLILAARRRDIGEDMIREAFELADLQAMRLHKNPATAKAAGQVLEELEGMRDVLLRT